MSDLEDLDTSLRRFVVRREFLSNGIVNISANISAATVPTPMRADVDVYGRFLPRLGRVVGWGLETESQLPIGLRAQGRDGE